VKNSTVVETTSTRKDPMRSDCIEGEMLLRQKLFGGRAPPGKAPAAFMGEQGNGEATAGRIKGEMGGWGEDRRKGREGRE